MKSYLLITLIIASKICNADIKIIQNPNNKWNLFDDKLRIKIGQTFSYIEEESFINSNYNIAKANLNHNTTGIINSKGVFIIPAALDVQYTINYDKKIIYQKKNNKLYLYNYSGILLHKIENLNFALIAPNVSNDLLLTHISNPDYSTEIIFINQNGQIAIQKNIIEQFNNKYIYNSFIKNTFPLMLKDERSAIIDNMGNFLIPPDNNKIAYITNTNYYIIKKNTDNCYLYNINDGKITQTDYSDFSVPMNEQFNNTIALKKSKSNTYDLYRYDNAFNLTLKFNNINIDNRYPKNETISIDNFYDYVDSSFKHFRQLKQKELLFGTELKYYILSKGDKKILVDRNLNLLVNGEFNKIEYYSSIYNNPRVPNIIFLKNDTSTIAYDHKNQTEIGTFKFINPQPEIISDSKLKFTCGDGESTFSIVYKGTEWTKEYSDNTEIEFIPFTVNNKWGLKTTNNQIVLNPIAKAIQKYKNYFYINLNGYYRIYNKQLVPISDKFTEYAELRTENGYAKQYSGAILLTNIGTKTDTVISNGALSIQYSTYNKKGFFQNGKQYLKCEYDEILKMPNGNFLINDDYRDKNTGDFGFISYILDSNGTQITPKTKGRLYPGSANAFTLTLQNDKTIPFTSIAGFKTHCKTNNIEAEKQNIATAQNNTNQSIASPEAEQKNIQEVQKKIQFKYVSNPNGTCKYCSKTIHCRKKTQSDINFDKEIMKLSMPIIFEMYNCLPVMLIFGGKEDPKITKEQLNGIFRISLYDCPTFCSIKCQDDCEKSNNCH
jgi:hypothetical protein